MIINKNFFSMIVLGNFNPSILNIKFLTDKNIISNDEKVLNEKYAPIFSVINFENMKLVIDYERFQVTEEKIDSFEKNRVIDFVTKYLSILEYTPIRVAGINFNIDMKIDILKYLELIKSKKLLDILKTEQVILDIGEKHFKNKEVEIISIKSKVIYDDNNTIQIGINKKNDDIFNLNYNFELQDLEKSSKRIFFFRDNFKNIYNDFNNNLKNLIGD